MLLRRGDVVLARVPYSDGTAGRIRPTVVVQADNLNTGINQAILAVVTTNTTRAGHPSRVLILVGTEQSRNAGLVADCVVMTDNLVATRHELIIRVIGHIDMADVDAALRHTLSL